MNKKVELGIFIITFFLLVLAVMPICKGDDFPTLPHYFYGYAFDENGDFISSGNITAKLNSKLFTTYIKNGSYGYIPITEGFPIRGTSSDAGDIIYFYINDTITGQTANFQAGGENVNYGLYFNLSFDTAAPIIDSVTTSSITSSSVKISWNTNENSNSTVNYGKTKQLGSKKLSGSFVKSHEVLIESLESDTVYYFEVISYDMSGNFQREDNSSNYYSFTTLINEEDDDDNGGNDNGGSNPGDNGGTPTNPPASGQENIPPIVNSGGPYYYKVNETILFDASASSDSDGYVVDYSWDFGDGSSQKTTDTTITHIYIAPNTYLVTLTITDDDGATNTTTTNAYITEADSDGDGWTDEAEEYYDYDPNDNSSYPPDNDNDKIPDDWDSDDDNDGLTDAIELVIGTNSTNKNDVLRIINEFGLFYLVDVNNDSIFDKYYNLTSKSLINLNQKDNNLILIDDNNDNEFDYSYNLITGEFKKLLEEPKSTSNYTTILIVVSVLVLLIIVFFYMLKKIRYGGKIK